MPNLTLDSLQTTIVDDVRRALAEDVGDGDITASLIPAERQADGRIITREAAVFCGKAWADEVARQVDPQIAIEWLVNDGDNLLADQTICRFSGPARGLLTAERSMLNFIQLLSATATRSRHFADMVAGTSVKLLDTRKTLPGLRLIKETHIAACGGIAQAISRAHEIAPGKPVEVEVESLDELKQALEEGADIVMLDELSDDDMRTAVQLNAGRAKLEASGGITEATLRSVAETGVDYISIGSMTKDVKAVDLSMRLRFQGTN